MFEPSEIFVQVCPIILCGGEGSRLWPVSRRDFPKQFVRLTGELSSFQQAALRLSGMAEAVRPIVVTGAAHEEVVRRQLAEIGSDGLIIVEPEARDSGPAVAAAAAALAQLVPGCIAVVQPADHHVPDIDIFHACVRAAAEGAKKGLIVTFGVAPTHPSTSFGYIEPASPVDGAPDVSMVARFVEKPVVERAREYIANGYVWNSGMFVFAPQVLLSELRKYDAAMADASVAAVGDVAGQTPAVLHLIAEKFRNAPKRSIDHAVMEHTKNAGVVRADFLWSDLGAWDAVHEALGGSEIGNAVVGDEVVVIDCEGCLIRAPGQAVAAIGLKNVGIIVESDAVLVCDLASSQHVKTAVETLRARAGKSASRSASHSVALGRFGSLEDAGRGLDRWLETAALPLWWAAGADHALGGFQEALDGDGRPVARRRRLRVQTRQAFVYATAGRRGWQGPWRSAARHGVDFVLDRYQRPDGQFRTMVDEHGAPADEKAVLYDQAFVLLSLASLTRSGVAAGQDARAVAHRLTDEIAATRAHPSGGFREIAQHGSELQSNPHMHLFEAALEWNAVEPDGRWAKLAGQILDLALKTFIDPEVGCLREFFAEDGRPMPGVAGTLVEPGHQFEWAWLLCRWNAIRPSSDVLAAARRLYEIGEQHGVDAQRNVAVDSLNASLATVSGSARLWPQTERAKAALALARMARSGEERSTLERSALAGLNGLAQYLEMPVHGLWRDNLRPNGTFVAEPSPASSLYHIVGAIFDLQDYVAGPVS
ncbi:MAG TPA: AGE family epimerase/isomerase [Rhizomicrobium sp.]|nr:AGE family epimerase/isomerase [Rhizomicrobium sp.]